VPERTVYLDHAATSALRPPSVAAAVVEYLEHIGATPGKGGHRLAIAGGRIALECRQRVAELLDIPGDVGRITFGAHATHALNTALWGTLRERDRVVVTAFDHNAVLRPCHALARERDVHVMLVSGAPDGSLDMTGLRNALDGARLLVINAASNVLGTTLDVSRLAALARDAGVLTLVDAAQVAGHVPFSAADSGVDMVAFTGHKGMLGPQGVGGLWARADVAVDPLITGGAGGDSTTRDMPEAWPDHLEAGTLNGPGLAGLRAGLDVVLAEGVAAIHARLQPLKAELHRALDETPGVRVLSPPAPDGVPLVTIAADALDAATFAARLDREHGVLTRPGVHCAPEAHRILGTMETGAVRLSLGWASTVQDVEHAAEAIRAVVA
jgi:cysteine desulfurase / selenocysteine lyase